MRRSLSDGENDMYDLDPVWRINVDGCGSLGTFGVITFDNNGILRYLISLAKNRIYIFGNYRFIGAIQSCDLQFAKHPQWTSFLRSSRSSRLGYAGHEIQDGDGLIYYYVGSMRWIRLALYI